MNQMIMRLWGNGGIQDGNGGSVICLPAADAHLVQRAEKPVSADSPFSFRQRLCDLSLTSWFLLQPQPISEKSQTAQAMFVERAGKTSQVWLRVVVTYSSSESFIRIHPVLRMVSS